MVYHVPDWPKLSLAFLRQTLPPSACGISDSFLIPACVGPKGRSLSWFSNYIFFVCWDRSVVSSRKQGKSLLPTFHSKGYRFCRWISLFFSKDLLQKPPWNNNAIPRCPYLLNIWILWWLCSLQPIINLYTALDPYKHAHHSLSQWPSVLFIFYFFFGEKALYFKYSSVYMSIPSSHSISPTFTFW